MPRTRRRFTAEFKVEESDRPLQQVAAEQAGDLLAREDGGQRVGLAWERDAGGLLGPVEGDGVEEAQGAHDRADAGRLEPSGDQVQLVVAHVLGCELVRRAAVEGVEAGDRADVAAAGGVGHVAQPHVVEHALAQRRDGLGLDHRNLLWDAENPAILTGGGRSSTFSNI
jgi:hypothetical protein